MVPRQALSRNTGQTGCYPSPAPDAARRSGTQQRRRGPGLKQRGWGFVDAVCKRRIGSVGTGAHDVPVRCAHGRGVRCRHGVGGSVACTGWSARAGDRSMGRREAARAFALVDDDLVRAPMVAHWLLSAWATMCPCGGGRCRRRCAGADLPCQSRPPQFADVRRYRCDCRLNLARGGSHAAKLVDVQLKRRVSRRNILPVPSGQFGLGWIGLVAFDAADDVVLISR